MLFKAKKQRILRKVSSVFAFLKKWRTEAFAYRYPLNLIDLTQVAQTGSFVFSSSLVPQIRQERVVGFITNSPSFADISISSPQSMPSFLRYSFGITIRPSLSIFAIIQNSCKTKSAPTEADARKTPPSMLRHIFHL